MGNFSVGTNIYHSLNPMELSKHFIIFQKISFFFLLNQSLITFIFSGRAGLATGQAWAQGHVPLLPRGGARQESEEEQADSAKPP